MQILNFAIASSTKNRFMNLPAISSSPNAIAFSHHTIILMRSRQTHPLSI
ncbi:hypothetical protein H6G33_28320 [Calothrix sp. FACHB-1219]|nr:MULTISPECIES: hypothetical protein [unclassified Calothrix]MBD2206114.1 hypothetical protein [Calothrix sp. FACHB-168]MBD2220885.1 hypothetical protein [Calothrix sp. FACHB-1219]